MGSSSGRVGRHPMPGGANPSTAALSLAGMPRSATIFACSSLRAREPEVARPLPGLRRVEHDGGGEAGAGAPGRAAPTARRRALTPVPLGQVEAPRVDAAGDRDRRVRSGAGGGLVPGSLVLIGGAPGIGKSTITTRGSREPLGRRPQGPLRIWRGVGCPGQIESGAAGSACARRSDRCRHGSGIRGGHAGGGAAGRVRVDSVQVLYDPALSGAPGSVSPGPGSRRAG